MFVKDLLMKTSVRKKWMRSALCRARQANFEELYIGVTINAVSMASGSTKLVPW